MIVNIRPEAYAHLTPLITDVYSRYEEDQLVVRFNYLFFLYIHCYPIHSSQPNNLSNAFQMIMIYFTTTHRKSWKSSTLPWKSDRKTTNQDQSQVQLRTTSLTSFLQIPLQQKLI